MQFGIFCEIPVPRPWTRDKERDAYHHTLAQAVLADELGYHSFWTVEHHFLEEFSHCSAPGVLYGAVAARTRQIRIGHGVRLLPFPYNHPIRAAEAAAVVDLLSDGRLEFGTGRSATRIELEAFGIDPDQTRPLWEEALEMVVGAWTQDVFEWRGPRFDFPPRRVIPKPLQQPHPPLWVASTSPESHELAGQPGPRPALLHDRRSARRPGRAHAALPQGARGRQADREVREPARGDLHDGALRRDHGRGDGERARLHPVVRADGRASRSRPSATGRKS